LLAQTGVDIEKLAMHTSAAAPFITLRTPIVVFVFSTLVFIFSTTRLSIALLSS
jgi:hypothetical protein